ncbi:alpha/beta fold hydrolase [Halalkalibacter urbisdiaboli]|uniref:alpha/beta fold hydrolase n=1 Tax=Halalkalibacter urbisdiaboli TaxID=1960589 RepID=UPI001FDA2E26|nr:alpha/beta hydrolase [Halalkalibacter urbisdiaboli]
MEKETIIFLHGIVGNKNVFKHEVETLNAHYHCISYDFYDPDDLGAVGLLSLDLLLDQLYAKFVKAGVEKAHLCALSFGCVVAQAFAKKYPSMVLSMTFVGGYCCNVPSTFSTNLTQVLQEKDDYPYEAWLRRCATVLNPNKEFIPEDSEEIFFHSALLVHPNVFEKAMRIQLEFDSKAALVGMNTPILWVMGEYDELYKSTLLDLKRYVPHVEYKELKHAGHVAHIHQHEQFMSIFQRFLNKNKIFRKRNGLKVYS